MGQSQSATPSRALHVLRVTPSSPASQTSIEPFFDFVVGYEGDSLSQSATDIAELERIVEAHEGRTLNLLVWNSKDQETRVVAIVPSRAWSQSSSRETDPQLQPSLLGLSMRICQPEFALDNVWHVLDVVEGSPAESAGLVPYGDYITGWSGGILSAENDFYDLVEAHIDKPLRVYVYSHDFNALREVVLVPNRHWGGTGLLGCVFGYGFLHRIPPRTSDHATTTLSNIHEEYEDQDLFVPVDDPRFNYVEKPNSHGEYLRPSDSSPPSRPAHRSGSSVSSPPVEEPDFKFNGPPHDHYHDHHAHEHSHVHELEHGHSHSHISPASTGPSTPNAPQRSFFGGGFMNGPGSPQALFSPSSRSSTPILAHRSHSFSSRQVPGNQDLSDDGSRAERISLDATSQGSLTSID